MLYLLSPDHALYWYGYVGSDLEDMTNDNGWSRSSFTFTAPTHQTNYLNLASSGSNNNVGVGTKTTHSASNVYAITEGVSASSGNYMMIGAYTSKVIVGSASLTKFVYVNKQTLTITNIGGAVGDGNYLFCYSGANQKSKLYAMWYT